MGEKLQENREGLGRRALSSDVEIVWALERVGQEWGE